MSKASWQSRALLMAGILLLIWQAGCGIAPTEVPTASVTPLPPTATITPSPTSTPTVTPWPEGTRSGYTLLTFVDYDAHQVAVAEGIEYWNNSPDALGELVLAIEPNLWQGCFMLAGIRADRGILGTELAGQRLTIQLEEALLPGEEIILTIDFTLAMPALPGGSERMVRELIFGYSARQMNLIDWFPFIVPYISGQGWALHEAGSEGEHLLYDPADFTILLLFPETTRRIPVIASPGSRQTFGNGGRYELKNARTFALSLSPEYQVESAITADGITIKSFFFPEAAAGGRQVLETARQAVELFGTLFGAYPHPVLTLVQGDLVPSMETDGLVFLGGGNYAVTTGSRRNFLTVLTLHETAHQWWFGMVGNDPAMEPWLDEALATWAEGIFYEKLAPDDLAWWQEQRQPPQREPSGWVDTTIYDQDRDYTDAVYLRGAMLLSDLRQNVGDEAFFAFLNDYTARFNGKRATADDLFRILRVHSRAEISDILGQYLQTKH